MDRSIAGLIGAVGALAAAGPSQAASVPVASVQVAADDAMRIGGYADLLKPIPNALAVREALAQEQAQTTAEPEVLTVQYYHHHHHHHHRYYRRRYHHHHHHHHHGFYR